MDSFTAIVTVLALGASQIDEQSGESAIKDAYHALTGYLREHYSGWNFRDIEEKPASEYVRERATELLRRTNAGSDPELAYRARSLIGLIRPRGSRAAASIHIHPADLEAADVRLENVLSAGSGISISGLSASGNITIGHVTAGVEPVDPWPLPGKSKK